MKKLALGLALSLAVTTSAWAHFQLLYTPESALERGEIIQLRHVFTHPFDDEHTMDMGRQHDSDELSPVEAFYVIHRGNKTDLRDTLKKISWQGNANAGAAYQSEYGARRMGDHVLVLKPAPYFEANEDTYIQQITKLIVNVAGMPTDWNANLGLKAEIVPLSKPYALWTGSTFSGVVMSQGKPVPFAELEIEYLNHDIDIAKNAMGKRRVEAPQDSFVTLSLITDANGTFTFGLPKSGWWGFAAVGVGPDEEYRGKELSQDAVIWVQVRDMK
ncbi:DUF4198 domain-containing protein [Geoalkalibacter halelectricus]|uniref:DUF4198 domain-containing protein n=1 Tax=Geoalkalibacter halelectricus TaxID=2847045 RepID=A0ABY5ZH77_9BACT|nr:DUF4198 domain-containing protein [Geoalkalibacter halelectricus]MDO3376619.1 DUF4198 domain-containing protein [Geoalkalibacter halelectricus]UWZ78423.1 DUF4198 domain-containing protein [Geoalkalibacter halelectricus]